MSARDPAVLARSAGGIATRPLMGGGVLVRVDESLAAPERAAAAVIDRIEAWAAILTRFEAASELSRLNADPRAEVPVGPTLAAVLDWAREAESATDGLVDVALLDARLAAETGCEADPPVAAGRRWSMIRGRRGATVVRPPGVRLDLDGVAKGWLADRALTLTPGGTAVIDADGDIAVRIAAHDEVLVGVADPCDAAASLASIRLRAGAAAASFGVATSGISVHRWTHAGRVAHHIIDPSTRRPALTDLVQATVVARSARLAEAFAKAAVIVGASRAPALATCPGVHGLLLLTASGELRATRGVVPWLA